MSTSQSIAAFFYGVYQILSPFLAVAVMTLGYWAVSELRQHGYRATYAEAIVRAMGAGVIAAQDAGRDPFTDGRGIVLSTGAKYLSDNVGKAGEALGLTSYQDHASRVEAQLGVVAAQADATAQVKDVRNTVLTGG